MANYDEAASTVVGNITNSNLNQATKDSINSIVNQYTASTGQTNIKVEDYSGGKATEGTLIVNVGKGVAVTEDPGAPVIIMSSEATQGANVTLTTADGPRTVVASNQADNITFTGNGNVTVETGGGNDTIVTGDGNNLVNVTGVGNSTVTTGTGNDKVVVQGEGDVQVNLTGGSNVVVLDSSTVSVSVTGGTGFDQVQIGEGREAHDFAIVDGKVVMHSLQPTTLDKVPVVLFDVNKNGNYDLGVDNITVIADSHGKSVVAKLYEVAFNREADLGGLEYWMGRVDQGDSLEHIVYSFINSAEFNTAHDGQSNDAYVKSLYTNFAGREADAEGLAYWVGRLESGADNRADVAWSFAESAEAKEVMGINGTNYVIDLF